MDVGKSSVSQVLGIRNSPYNKAANEFIARAATLRKCNGQQCFRRVARWMESLLSLIGGRMKTLPSVISIGRIMKLLKLVLAIILALLEYFS